jgi:hypothetical protein
MIGPTSDTAKAMMQSLQQKMQMGMPIDQAIQYVKSQAATGVAPFVDLYALLNQYERMKQPPKQMPAGGTIKQQLDNLESVISGGGANSPRGGSPETMMAQGLGALNAGAMEDPTFASGGIVAFDEGGVTAANVKKPLPKTWEEVQAQAAAALGQGETIEDLEKELARQDEIEKKLGIGRYAPSRGLKEAEAERKRKAQQQAESELDELDRAKFFSDVAEIGSEAGTRETKAPTFLTAISKARARQLERKEKKIERGRTAEDAYNASKIAMAEAEEARAEGNLTKYRTKVAEARKLYDEATEKVAAGSQKKEEDLRSRQTQRIVNEIQQGEENRLIRQINQTPKTLNGQLNPKYKDLVDKLNDIKSAGRLLDKDTSFDVQRKLYTELYTDAYKKYLNAYDDEERAVAQEEMLGVGQQLAKLGIPVPRMGGKNPPNVATPQAPTSSNWE